MLGRGAANGSGREKSGFDTLIARDVSIHGTMKSSGTLRVDGTIDGEVQTAGDLIVGETGVVTARVQAGNVVIAGEVHGNVEVTGRLHVLPGGKLFGDAKVGTLVVEEGAAFKGQCEMEVKQTAKKGEAKERTNHKADNAVPSFPPSSPRNPVPAKGEGVSGI